MFVDGNFALDGFTSYNQLSLSLTVSIDSGRHQLRVAKMIEACQGEAILEGIQLSPGGRFLADDSHLGPEKRLLLLGDSYSVGFGNAATSATPADCNPAAGGQLSQQALDLCSEMKLSSSSECANFWMALNQNNLQAFGSLVGEAFNADYQVIARTGSGLVGYSQASLTLPGMSEQQYAELLPSSADMFPRSLYSDPASQYDLSGWIPQVVVVGSGLNDWQTSVPMYSVEAWTDRALAFLGQVSSKLGDPIMVLLIWPVGQDVIAAPGSSDPAVQYKYAMSQLQDQANKQMPSLRVLTVDPSIFNDKSSWCLLHPSAVAHRLIASQLVNFLEGLVPAWVKAKAVDLSVDQTALRPQPSGSLSPGSSVQVQGR